MKPIEKKYLPEIKTNEFIIKFKKDGIKNYYALKKNEYSFLEGETEVAYIYTTFFPDTYLCPKINNLFKYRKNIEFYSHSLFSVIVGFFINKKSNKTRVDVSLSLNLYPFYNNGFQYDENTNYRELLLKTNKFTSYNYENNNLKFPLFLPITIKGMGKNNTLKNEEIIKINSYIYSL